MSRAFEDIQGAEAIVDDIIIWGRNEEEQNNRLKQALQRAKDTNLKLNAGKCKIQTSELTYICHIMSNVGIKAIKDIGTPQDKELIRFIHMVDYLGKFIPGLSDTSLSGSF